MKLMLLVLAAACIALISGCIGQTTVTVSDLSIVAGFDPTTVKANEPTSFFIDLENTGITAIGNLTIDVFDTGILGVLGQTPCAANYIELRPSQLESLDCQMQLLSPSSLIQPSTTTTVRFRTAFQKTIAGSFIADVITLDELRRLERTGALQYKAQSITFGDSQMQATLQFNKQPPFLAGETVIAQLTVQNIGPGKIYTLDPTRFSMNQTGSEFDCNFASTLYSTGQFPPITCTFIAPSDIGTIATYPLTLTFGYDYELTQSASLTVEKS